MARYSEGETAFFVESNIRVIPCKVVRYSCPFVTISFRSVGGSESVIMLRETRLFKSQDEAEAEIKRFHPELIQRSQRTPYGY